MWDNAQHSIVEIRERIEHLKSRDGKAVLVPAVVSVPEMSSRNSAVRAIIARALSFTVDGAWPSCQSIVPSAVALCQRFGSKDKTELSPPILL